MDKLELTWETFEFHLSSSTENESKLLDSINRFKDSFTNLDYQAETSDLIDGGDVTVNNLNELIACSNELINDYKKQNSALKDLTSIYKSLALDGTPIPAGREVSIMSLNELRNTNSTMIEQLNIQREEFKSLLG